MRDNNPHALEEMVAEAFFLLEGDSTWYVAENAEGHREKFIFVALILDQQQSKRQ